MVCGPPPWAGEVGTAAHQHGQDTRVQDDGRMGTHREMSSYSQINAAVKYLKTPKMHMSIEMKTILEEMLRKEAES